MELLTIVIFGITGDLSKRFLLPAVEALATRGQPLILIGAAHDAQYAMPLDGAYYSLNFNNVDDFKALAELIQKKEHANNAQQGKRIFYCATATEYFATITQNLATVGLLELGNKNHRMAFEKPFGHDLDSARQLNAALGTFCSQEQIFRIDHYLNKQLASSIALLRFTNVFFEPVWNKNFIEKVEIDILETDSIHNRGKYYDNHGALKDVMQNHVLQLLALCAMEEPSEFTGNALRDKKAELLKSLKVEAGVLGQYEGYLSEKYVAEGSTTETFAHLKLIIDTPRWEKVPFYVTTGKCLEKKITEIRIYFKQQDFCLFSESMRCISNIFTFRISPDDGFSLQINAKKPHTVQDLIATKLDFCYHCLFDSDAPSTYETILQELCIGDQSTFVRMDEIEYQWQLIDAVKKLSLPLVIYQKNSEGPRL